MNSLPNPSEILHAALASATSWVVVLVLAVILFRKPLARLWRARRSLLAEGVARATPTRDGLVMIFAGALLLLFFCPPWLLVGKYNITSSEHGWIFKRPSPWPPSPDGYVTLDYGRLALEVAALATVAGLALYLTRKKREDDLPPEH